MSEAADTKVESTPKQRSLLFSILSVLGGAAVFLVIIPLILYYGSVEIQQRWLQDLWRTIETVLAAIALGIGAILLVWSGLVFYFKGGGTPAPTAPPERLVTSGPFKYSRNPIQLGAMLFYFAVGTYLSSIGIGIAMFLLALVLGGLYHKLYEEKELAARFGKEYEDYKAKTPFLWPKLWS
jgi:protein-S-isoprenylcysteine O-methyltransferase Ste14